MKNVKYNTIKTSLWFFLFIVTLGACNETERFIPSDGVPPAMVTNVTFKPDHGGGVFYYDVPKDEDILMVKAVYTLDSGEEIYKTSSFYTDSLLVAGLGTEKEYTIKLVSVDRGGNESPAVIQKVTPLEPFTSYVLNTVEVIGSFSSVYVKWQNILEEQMAIIVSFQENGNDLMKSYSSVRPKDNMTVTGLKGNNYSFSIRIKDAYGNITEPKQFEGLTILQDEKLSKEKWSWLENHMLSEEINEEWIEIDEETGEEITQTRTLTQGEKGGHNGGWNGKEWEYEGHILKLWDDIIDDGAIRNMNFCASGNGDGLPQSYYIDLGRQVKASRVTLWQRDWDYRTNSPGYYYQMHNVEKFEIWISNDKENWEKVNSAQIIKPSDPIVARQEGLEGHQFVLYPNDPRFTKEFRYLEFRATKTFGDTSFLNCSELTLHGMEVN